MQKSDPSTEETIYYDILELLGREVAQLKTHRGLDDVGIQRLGRLVSIYSTLKGDLRDDVKAGIKKEVGDK